MDEKKTILTIDDDQDVLDALRAILENAGYKVVEANSGAHGLKAFNAEKPDLVIVDLMMESMEAGLEFVRSVRESHHKLPVFMLSSVGDALNSTSSFSDLGLSGVIQKPVDSSFFLKMIETRLG